MALASSVDVGDGHAAQLDEAARAALERLHNDRASQGFRFLAVAWKTLPSDHKELKAEDECGLVIAGFCVFVDPPKAGAAAAIGRLAAAGVAVKVVSGDHEIVVRHLAETMAIPAQELLTGAELSRAGQIPRSLHEWKTSISLLEFRRIRKRVSSARSRGADTPSASSAMA